MFRSSSILEEKETYYSPTTDKEKKRKGKLQCFLVGFLAIWFNLLTWVVDSFLVRSSKTLHKPTESFQECRGFLVCAEEDEAQPKT